MERPLPLRIWLPWGECETACLLRRRFELDAPRIVALRVCSSGAIRAWFDGEPCQLPAAQLPTWRTMRSVERELAAGAHEIAIAADPGPHDQPFLLACLDWEDGLGPRRVPTDGDWTARRIASASDPDLADRTGAPAWVSGGVWAEPWGLPCDAPADFCRLSTGWQAVRAERLTAPAERFDGLSSKGARAQVADGRVELIVAEPHAQAPPVLPQARPAPTWYRTREGHSRLTNRWLELFDARAPRVVYDLGAETFARLRVRLAAGGPATLAVLSGESRGELERYPARVADVVRLSDGESFTTCPTGMRFAALMGLSHAGPALVLEPPEVEHVHHPLDRRGSFACSDPALEALWDLCARTVHLCLQNELWDGIKRDQLPWMGDLYVEALAVLHAFGDRRLVRRTLALLGDMAPGPRPPLAAQRYPGLYRAWASDEADINGIPSYTLWWLWGLADYVRYSGDEALVDELSPRMAAAVEHVCSWVDASGWWSHRAGWDFVDWSPLDCAERRLFCHLLALEALGQAAALIVLRHPDCARRAQATRRRMLAAVREEVGARGLERLLSCHQVAAMAILCGAVEGERARELFERALAPDPPLRMTFWHRHSDLEAARRLGRTAWGLDYVRRHWGPALRADVSTLWEAFEPEWLAAADAHAVSVVGPDHARYGGYETSLCHGWSAGPLVWLHRAVLGVEVLGPDHVRVAPSLGDLDWARGVVPTARGPLAVEARAEERGRLTATVRYPAGVRVELAGQLLGQARLEEVRP